MTSIFFANKSLFYSIIAVLGLLVGSFCNVAIYRLPIMIKEKWRREALAFLQQQSSLSYHIFNLFLPRSHCPKCQHQISMWCNIPLISYLCLRGKCKHCKAGITWRYPLVEAISCLSALAVAFYFGPTWQTAALLLLTWALLILVFIDFEHQLLPDDITLSMLWLGLLVNSFHLFTALENAVLGAIFGYGILWIIAQLFRLIRRRDGMGHGDFKLLAVFGAWLGWQVLPFIIFFASLFALIVGFILILLRKLNSSTPMPFGPYLALTGWLTFFVRADIFMWYRQIFLNF